MIIIMCFYFHFKLRKVNISEEQRMAAGGTVTGSTDKMYTEKSYIAPCTTREAYRSRVWEDLRELFQQDHLTDVMLAAEGRSIPCHKVLLAAASKFFRDKFIIHPELLEHNILDIDGIDFDTLTSVVAYIYSDNVELTVKKTETLLPASVSLMLSELTNECKNFLDEELNSDTSDCSTIHKIAKANSLTNTADKAWRVLLRNFEEVVATDAVKDLTKSELLNYIRDEDLNVASEDPVFEAVVTWVRHDLENRKDAFEGLMEHITLSHCSLTFLGDVVMKEHLVQSGSCLQNVAKAMHVHATSPSLKLGTPRKGFTSSKVAAKVECVNPLDDTESVNGCTLVAVYKDQIWMMHDGETKWVKQKYSEIMKSTASAVCIKGDTIVLTGGYKNGAPCRECLQFSVSTLAWSFVPPMTAARSNHVSVCAGDTVFVLGGDSWNFGFLKSVEYLDMRFGRWVRTADMPEIHAEITAVQYKHFIYVFAAYRNSKQTFAFDAVTQKWRKKRNMPRYCAGASSVVYGEMIYVLGGDDRSCMSYDPDQETWKIHSKCSVKHDRGSAVVWKDRILLCSGESTSVIEEYDPHTDTWSKWRHQLPHWIKEYAMFAVQM